MMLAATTPAIETTAQSACAREVFSALSVLLETGSVHELRIPDTHKGTVSGYFNDLEAMARNAADWSGNAPAVYFTLNPAAPEILCRAKNRLNTHAKRTTTDKEILHRRWLPVDIDPVRSAGISSTDTEHVTALAKAQQIKTWLSEQGWPLPLAGDSGNGANLLYRIELPNGEPCKYLVERVLKALSQKFSDPQNEIDQTVSNAARIWKVYGTLAGKGDDAPELGRPHRASKLLEIPERIEIVGREQLEAVATLVAEPATKKASASGKNCNSSAVDAGAWLTKHSLAVASQAPYEGGQKFILQSCPLNPEHQKSAFVIQFPSGKISAGCLHSSCADLDWKRLQDIYDPAASWESELLCSEKGVPRPILRNAVTLLRHAPEWQNVLVFNEFSLYAETGQPAPWPQSASGGVWTDDDDSRTTCWLQQQGVLVNSKVAAEACQIVAREHQYHPVKSYLAGLVWDQEPRCDIWLTDYLGAEDSALNAGIGSKWLIQAVARIIRPGIQADATLLLVGCQGIGKSSALRVLASPPWFTDHLSDLGSKDSRIELHGKWIVELAEFTSRRSELERKGFLTACADNFRAPYERRTQWVPRSNVFSGTTNDPVPLTDETGGRRYWSVTCRKVNIEKLKADRDQLWAEAYARYSAGEAWHDDLPEFSEALAAEQESRYMGGPFDAAILPWLDNPRRRAFDSRMDRTELRFDSEPGRVTINDCLLHAVGKAQHDINKRDQLTARGCLVHAGWQQKIAKIAGTKCTARFYERIRPVEGIL